MNLNEFEKAFSDLHNESVAEQATFIAIAMRDEENHPYMLSKLVKAFIRANTNYLISQEFRDIIEEAHEKYERETEQT